MKRDAKKDLELCKQATQEPWEAGNVRPHKNIFNFKYHSGVYARSVKKGLAITGKKNDKQSLIDAFFIAESREALPYWINRAQRAEELLKEVIRDQKGISEIILMTNSIKRFLGQEEP